jgi:hypothetical protein
VAKLFKKPVGMTNTNAELVAGVAHTEAAALTTLAAATALVPGMQPLAATFAVGAGVCEVVGAVAKLFK